MADAKAHQPEKKIGPFHAGIGVAVWLNVSDTEDGPRPYRTVTISPRRYQDRQTGEWRDSGSFYVGDLPALIFALAKAQEFAFETPIPDQSPATDSGRERGSDEEIPF